MRASTGSTPPRRQRSPASRSSPPPTRTSARSSHRRSRVSTSGWDDRTSPTAPFASSATSWRSSSARRAPRASTPPSSSPSTTTRFPSWSIRWRALEGDVLLYPEAGTNVCTSHPAERDEALFDGCDVVVSGTPGQSAAGRVPARVACVRRRRGGRRPVDALALDPDAAPGPRRTRDDPRPGARIQCASSHRTSAGASGRSSWASRRSSSRGWRAGPGAPCAGRSRAART